MKGQTALEYLIVASFVIAAIIPVFFYSLVYSSDSIRLSQAQDAVNSISKVADFVYSFGEGSSYTVLVTLPENIENSTVSKNVLSLKLKTSSGLSDVIAITKASLNGTLPKTSGVYKILLNMTGASVTIKQV